MKLATAILAILFACATWTASLASRSSPAALKEAEASCQLSAYFPESVGASQDSADFCARSSGLSARSTVLPVFVTDLFVVFPCTSGTVHHPPASNR
jgi:hypothetical protein